MAPNKSLAFRWEKELLWDGAETPAFSCSSWSLRLYGVAAATSWANFIVMVLPGGGVFTAETLQKHSLLYLCFTGQKGHCLKAVQRADAGGGQPTPGGSDSTFAGIRDRS